MPVSLIIIDPVIVRSSVILIAIERLSFG